MSSKTMVFVGLALTAGGCMTDDPALDEASEELASVGMHSMIASQDLVASIGGGLHTQCFLATVDGDISAGFGQFGGAGAGVRRVNGVWELWAKPSSGGVHVEAMCAESPSISVEYTWSSGAAPTVMKPTIGWRCFLTEVTTAPTQFTGGAFHSDADAVAITASGGSWQLGGALVGGAVVKARCVQPSSDFGQLTVSAPAGQTTSVETALLDNTIGCGLTALTGHLDAGSRGVDLNRIPFPGTTAYVWRLYAKDTAGGSFRCVR